MPKIEAVEEAYEELLALASDKIWGVRNTIASLGPSGVGKTAEIIRSLKGDGTDVNTKSTSIKDIQIQEYICNVMFPIKDLSMYHVIVKRPVGFALGIAKCKDPSGQYDTLITQKYDITKKGEKQPGNLGRGLNIDLLSKNAVLEAVIDSTRPESIEPLIDKWMDQMLFKEAHKNEGAMASFYFSKAALSESKIDFDEISLGEYESLHNTFPRLNDLIEKFESHGHKVMGFVGDISIKIGEEYKSSIYLIKTNKWLEEPIETKTERALTLSGPKALPLIKYWYDNGYTADVTNDLIQIMEDSYPEAQLIIY